MGTKVYEPTRKVKSCPLLINPLFFTLLWSATEADQGEKLLPLFRPAFSFATENFNS
jgi:hypothetical protein